MSVIAWCHRGGAVLVLSNTELSLQPLTRPVVVRRWDVLAVRGTVPGRPL